MLGPDFYQSFPPPWNVLPQASGMPADQLYKLSPSAIPKFEGDRTEYLTWRSTFIPCVHLSPVDISYKILILRNCLVPKDPRMRELKRSLVGTAEGYRQTVMALEQRYGGEDALLLARQEDLRALPVVKENDYRSVEAMHLRLGTYLLEWSSMGTGSMGTYEMFAFFSDLMRKLEPAFANKYASWLRLHGKQRGIDTLHMWLGDQLADLRLVDQFVRRNSETELRRRPLAAPPPARSSLPSSYLDKNIRGRTYLTQDVPEAAPDAVDSSHEEEEVFLTQEAPRVPLPCPACKESHPLGRCPKFKEMSMKVMTFLEGKRTLDESMGCYLIYSATSKKESEVTAHLNLASDYSDRIFNFSSKDDKASSFQLVSELMG